jgi:hypothetical protein
LRKVSCICAMVKTWDMGCRHSSSYPYNGNPLDICIYICVCVVNPNWWIDYPPPMRAICQVLTRAHTRACRSWELCFCGKHDWVEEAIRR